MIKIKNILKMEENCNRKINKIRGQIMPLVNLFFIPFMYFLLYQFGILNVAESIVLAFVILGINLYILDKITTDKENRVQEVVYIDVLPTIFSKYFQDYTIKRTEGLSVKDIKKSDLLTIGNGSIFDKEDYMKVKFIDREYELSDVRNSVNGMEYNGSTVDCGVLVKTKKTNMDFKFVIREIGKFDYKKEYFVSEKIDLYEVDNIEFEEKYTCYTNNNEKMDKFLTTELINYLIDIYNINRVEISGTGEEIFILINNLSLDFSNKYDSEYKLDINKIEKDSEQSLKRLIQVLKELDI